MPNGWYPVDGLDVVLINRTEQRYPRLDWGQSWDVFWAAAFFGSRGFAPLEPVRPPRPTAARPFDELLESIREIITDKPDFKDARASAVYIDFKRREGFVAGSFCVYGFSQESVTILRDPTVGALMPEEARVGAPTHILETMTTLITASGMLGASDAPPPQFEFPHMNALVVSSVPLHYDAHWPPKNSLDCVAIALARPRTGDALIASWQAPAEGS